MTEETLVAVEGTVAVLDTARVGIGNIWERRYELPDGTERTGITAMLHLDGDRVLIAGAGSELEDGAWRVDHVQAGAEAAGEVRFTRVSRGARQ